MPVPAIVLFFFCLTALGRASAVWAGSEAALGDFLQKVEKRTASINSFSCNFTQVKHLAIFPRPVKFSGRLSLVRPDKLRWQFLQPLPSVIVLNGNQGLKCEGEGPVRKFSLDRDPVMRLVAEQLWAWTSGSYRELRDDFDFSLLPGPVLVFSPVRKDTASFISKIKVAFDPDFLQPLEVEISEPGDDRTVIYFSDYQRNLDLNDELFTKCGPAGISP
jgi:outer membrane lipoprotein-sorting protein